MSAALLDFTESSNLPPTNDVQCVWQDHVARLREGHEARCATADSAAEARLAAALAAKQEELGDIVQQLHTERLQHRTAQASLDK